MIIKSPFADVTIPDVSMTELAFHKAEEWADQPAMIEGPTGRTLTFAQLHGGVRKVATGLAQRGFGQGDVLAIYSPNIPEYTMAFHGVAMLGGIVTTINPLYTADELAKQLIDADAKYLVTIGLFLDKAKEAAAKSGIQEVFVFGEAEGATPFADLLSHGDSPPSVSINPAEDIIVLPYSSGTTGLPKGVMLTHRNLVANVLQMEGANEGVHIVESGERMLGVLPFFHIYGMVVIMNYALYRGAAVVTMPKFDMEDFLNTLQTHKVNTAPLVPPIVLGLAKHPAVANYDLSSLNIVFSGAAPLGSQVAQEASARIETVVSQGYGLTETSPVTHLGPNKDLDKLKPASIGVVVSNTEVKIVDVESGEAVGPNKEGEMWVRGPQVMKGYLNRPEDTAAAIDSEGWFKTGDIAYADEDGYFFIVDRLKELIKVKGYQVAPAELEALLLSHPAVADAAVIPIQDEEAGEVPMAFVVKKEEVNEEALIEFITGQVAPFKRIRKLVFTEQIPKSASGKILRRLLVDQVRGEAG